MQCPYGLLDFRARPVVNSWKVFRDLSPTRRRRTLLKLGGSELSKNELRWVSLLLRILRSGNEAAIVNTLTAIDTSAQFIGEDPERVAAEIEKFHSGSGN